MKKRGQFFLLAAVIISVVVLSLGVTTNQAIFSEEPKNFYDFSYEVKREVSAVSEYEVYSNIDDSTNLDDFVDALSEDIKERSPESDFVFIYGDEDESLKIRAYGNVEASVDGEDVSSTNSLSKDKVCLGNFCQGLSGGISDFVDSSTVNTGDKDDIFVTFKGNNYKFPSFRNKQVLFIIQKNVGDESYVNVG